MCEQVSPGHNTWNKARRPWLESSILGWHRTQEEPGNATDALKLDSLALWPLAKYTVDYPQKQKCQCFSEDPDETPASHGIRCKYSDLWGKKCHQKIWTPVKDKTAKHLKMPALQKDVPKKAEKHSKKEGRGRGRRMSQEMHQSRKVTRKTHLVVTHCSNKEDNERKDTE